jgi:hypothetical protein
LIEMRLAEWPTQTRTWFGKKVHGGCSRDFES